MLERLRKTGRGEWLDQEMERLADPANYVNDPAQAWKQRQDPEPQARGARPAEGARRLARARGTAKNLPRGRIMKDETLADVAIHPPASQDDLGQVRGLSAGLEAATISARG